MSGEYCETTAWTSLRLNWRLALDVGLLLMFYVIDR